MIGCFDRLFLLAGACDRCVKHLTQCFCLRNFLAFIAFLAHFSYAIACVACVAFEWKPGFRLRLQVCWWHNRQTGRNVCLPHAPDWSAIVCLAGGYKLSLLDVGETIAARGVILTRWVANVKNLLIVYSNSENVAQLLMIFSDFVRFLATSGQLLTLKR